ncbi:hypothetical protein DOTSEDRAFT_33250 [Dothistroma septosporum NZE10]|uniref:C3H1-type domain-containing protein n=1 Tax=Dothistroma septosporum (strain NZE10 / CBS 128990) TaxID=675120 RepID=N1PUQ4_DOTSN|nr:hypothetical protein DOTSEDRAFT_33250 [Dothistroma septosporum NZE10]
MSTYNTGPQQSHFMVSVPSAPQVASAIPAQSRLTHFIARNNGLPVPLIPADELPFSVKLHNVPRVLTPTQAYGLHYCGTAPDSGTTFQLEHDTTPSALMQRSTSQPQNETQHVRSQTNATSKHFLAPGALARQALRNSSSNSCAPQGTALPKRQLSASENAMSWRRSDPIAGVARNDNASNSANDAAQSVIDAILRSETGAEAAERIGYHPKDSTPPPSGVVPDQEKKEYCTYWILHGDCMYVQQGCRYKHEMPSKEKLQQIGIRHVPRWWQEQNAAIRMGGEKAIVGPFKRPEEWLNTRKGSDTISEASSSSRSSGTTSCTSEEEKMAVKQEKRAVPKSETKVKSRSTVPGIPPIRPSSRAEAERERTPSSGSDLIDFAPLVPAPTQAETPPVASASKRTVATMERSATKPAGSSNSPGVKAPRSPPRATKVFVPAGESPKLHLADAKKREWIAATKAARTPSPSKYVKLGDVKILKKEGSETQIGGLAASKWAPKADETAAVKETHKRGKSGCRIRRPASFSPATRKKTEGTGEEK